VKAHPLSTKENLTRVEQESVGRFPRVGARKRHGSGPGGSRGLADG